MTARSESNHLLSNFFFHMIVLRAAMRQINPPDRGGATAPDYPPAHCGDTVPD